MASRVGRPADSFRRCGKQFSCKLILGGGPRGEELEGVRGRCAGGSGVHVELQTRCGGQFHRFEVQVELPDDGVAEPLLSVAVELHIVGGPPLAEELGPGGQLTDQRDEGLVLRVAAGLKAKHGGGIVGDAVVVDEELAGFVWVQVDEAGGVGRTTGVGEYGEYSALAS